MPSASLAGQVTPGAAHSRLRAAPPPSAAAALLLLALGACAPGLKPITGPSPVAPAPAPARTVPERPLVQSPEEEYLLERQLMVPVAGVLPERVRDDFRAPRGNRIHAALDILAPRGTPVLAADDGRVLRVSESRLGGLTVYAIDREERYVYYYAHLDGYREGLRAGMALARGDVIGYVGTTGNAPANVPHLHFQLMRYRPERYWDGEPVNPKPYLALPGAAATSVAADDRP